MRNWPKKKTIMGASFISRQEFGNNVLPVVHYLIKTHTSLNSDEVKPSNCLEMH